MVNSEWHAASVKGMSNLRTVRQILTAEWLAAGNTGEPTVDWIRSWRRANPDYGMWRLNTRFYPGSLNAIASKSIEEDPDERATEFPELRAKYERDMASLHAWQIERDDAAVKLAADLGRPIPGEVAFRLQRRQKLDHAISAWKATSHGDPIGPEWEKFLNEFTDDLCEDLHPGG